MKTLLYIIGFGRTGHSIVAAMLDAHPNIQICIDGYHFEPTENIIQTLIDNSAIRAASGLYYPNTNKNDKDNAPDYSFAIPGWYQGTNNGQLDIVGYKSAHSSVIMHDTNDFDMVNRMILQPSGLSVKMIIPCRNPYDSISSLAHMMPIDRPSRISYFTEEFKKHLKVVNHYLALIPPENVLYTYHEEFITDPRAFLTSILNFLDEPIPDGFLDMCEAMTFKTQRFTRYIYEAWSDYDKAIMELTMRDYPFLGRYARDI